MTRAKHGRFAILVGGYHWLFFVVNRALYGIDNNARDFTGALAQGIAIAGAITLVLYLFARSRGARAAVIAFVIFINVLLIASGMYFDATAHPFHLSALEGWRSLNFALLSSVAALVDWRIALQIFVIVLGASGLIYCSRQIDDDEAKPTLSRTVGASLLLLGSLGTLVYSATIYPVKNLHPFLSLIPEYTPVANGFRNVPVADLAPIPDINPKLGPALFGNDSPADRPLNVVFVVLESVGAQQIFDASGDIDSTLMPKLASISAQGIRYDQIYSVFPGTVRTHVALNTGGSTITWGNVFHELDFPYTGKTLAREFTQSGYQTALFSSQRLDFENMDGFYEHAGYQDIVDPAQAGTTLANYAALNSWGVPESATIDAVDVWLKHRDNSKPFLLSYLTVATHHPYSWPDDFVAPFSSETDRQRYNNALAYTDHALEKLVQVLTQRGVIDNTLLVITGDHGQAFGDIHTGNLIHKNFLYEENVRSFLVVSKLDGTVRDIYSRRIGDVGNIMPTILNVSGAASEDNERDLTRDTFHQHPAVFYKNAYPALLGIRYGQWKFIDRLADIEGHSRAELYDLLTDPNEQINVATQHVSLLQDFRSYALNWYFETNAQFTRNLSGYAPVGERSLNAIDLKSVGPKLLQIGHGLPTERKLEFRPATRLHPDELVIAWTYWLPQDETQDYVLKWRGPSGSAFDHPFTLTPGWAISQISYDGPLPMAEGKWTLAIAQNEKEIIKTSFTVAANATLHQSANKAPHMISCQLGVLAPETTPAAPIEQRFQPQTDLSETQLPVVFNQWEWLLRKKEIRFRWRDPNGNEVTELFTAKQGWNKTWWEHKAALPLSVGNWKVSVEDVASKQVLCEEAFHVSKTN